MMGEQSAEGTVNRNLGLLARQNPELAPMAVLLIRHLGSRAYFEPMGSESRDAEARRIGEFRGDFVYQAEAEHPAGNDIEKELLHAS